MKCLTGKCFDLLVAVDGKERGLLLIRIHSLWTENVSIKVHVPSDVC